MKKFGIFLLGIIVAVIGFYFLSNKTEPLPDNPPSNIEQPGDENEQPGDNNETPTPDNPGDVGSEIQYTTNTFNMAHCAANLYRDVDGGWVYVDVPNGFDNVQIVVGDRYNLHLYPHESYAITEVVYNNECIWSGYHTDIYSAVSTVFTAVENGIFEVITQPVDAGSETQYTTNTFNLGNSFVVDMYIYDSATNSDYSIWPLETELDSYNFVVSNIYSLHLSPNEGYVITEVSYNGGVKYSGNHTTSDGNLNIGFHAVENGIFEVITQPVDAGSETQYTTNTFNLGNSLAVDMYMYNSATNSNDCIWPLETELDSYNFVVGADYYLHLSAIDGYEITEVYYNSDLVYSGDACLTVAVSFRAVENGVFEVRTQSDPTAQIAYQASDIVLVDASDYTLTFRNSDGNEVDTLYAGQDYTLEISINDTDRIITLLENNFSSPIYPNSQTVSFAFTMYNADPKTVLIWAHTSLTSEAVNLTMGDFVGASVTLTGLDGQPVQSYYASAKYDMTLKADSDYKIIGYAIGSESTYFEYPIYGNAGDYTHIKQFTIPDSAVGSVEFVLLTEYVGAE